MVRNVKYCYAIIFLIITLLLALGCSKNLEDSKNQKEENQETVNGEKLYNPLTGREVLENISLTAVIVDNLRPARPQTGLAEADIVYEIEMEGRITRFIALYHGDPPQHVGPVRSARPYAVSIAKEWEAYYVHAGGSMEAFRLIDKLNIRDICAIQGHQGFWLDSSRPRPHNTYIDLEKALSEKKDNGRYKEWNFTEKKVERPDYKELRIRYNSANNIKYVWDEEEGRYLRYLNNQAHRDRASGEQIKADNIIVQYTSHVEIGNELEHIDVKIIGQGDADYFLGGQHISGRWEKENHSAPTKFYDAQGKIIEPAKGNTWIQIVRTDSKIEKKN